MGPSQSQHSVEQGLQCQRWVVGDSCYSPPGCRASCAGVAMVSVPSAGAETKSCLFQPPALGSKMVSMEGGESGEGEHVLTSRKHLWKLWSWAVPSFLFFPLFSCFVDLQTENAMNGNCCALFLGGILRTCQCHHRPPVACPGASWSVPPLLLPVWEWFLWSSEGSPNPLLGSGGLQSPASDRAGRQTDVLS